MGELRISGSTRVVGVLGSPIEHSLSPTIHNAAFDALGMDWTYVALPVAEGAVPEAVRGLAALGFAGANVTMPHKEAVADAVDRLSDDAKRLHAVNTVELVGGAMVGHNTDAPGFARFLALDAAFDAAGRTALLYGAGGAARACALALARAGLTRLVVAVRAPARATELEAALREHATEVEAIAFDEAAATRPELIVNATPVGGRGETLPLPALDERTVAVDLLYRPAITPLLRAVRGAGGSAFGGLGLLLHQAALSFEIWTAMEPPLEVMSAAALAALAEP